MLTLFRAIFAPPRDLILLVIAGWIGLSLADRRARASMVGERGLDTLVLSSLAAFVLGGRLLFAAAHSGAFIASPLGIFSLNTSAFDMLGAAVSAGVVGAVVIQRRRIPAWEALDLLVPLGATLAIGLSLSHLASGVAFGKEAQLPWSIQLWGAERHPTQVYELIASALTLAVVMLLSQRRKAGELFLTWLGMAAASRLVIEGFRGDSTLVFGGIRLAQIVSWIVLAGALIGLELMQKRGLRKAADTADASSLPGNKTKRTAEHTDGA